MTAPQVLPQPESTYQLLPDAARAWPDHVATQWIPDPADYAHNLTWTYADLAATVTRIANGLAGLGPDAVTLCGQNTSILFAATLAAQAAGIAAPSTPPSAKSGSPSTGGQDRAAAVRRVALAAAVRSARLRDAMASTATPRLKTGALQPEPGRLLPRRLSRPRVGGLIPNPLVRVGDGEPVRLDTLLAGRTGVLTARRPEAALVDLCRRHDLLLIRISAGSDPASVQAGADWTEARLAGGEPLAVRRALTADPALTAVVRPDRVVAAVAPGRAPPRLPWAVPPGPHPSSPGSAAPEQPGTAVRHPRPGQAIPPGP